MEGQASEPLLARDDGEVATVSSWKHRLHESLRRMKMWSVHIWEDDQEYLASECSRRPFLKHSLPIFFALVAFGDMSVLLAMLGVRVRYLAGTLVLSCALLDHTPVGVLFLAVSLTCFYLVNSVFHRFSYTAFSLKRSLEVLIQNAGNGSCTLDADEGFFVTACPRVESIFSCKNLSSRRLRDYVDVNDQSRIDEVLRSAKQGRLDQCLVTCHVRDAAIVFDTKLVAYKYNRHLNSVDACLQIQGEVRPCHIGNSDNSGVGACTIIDRNKRSIVNIDGASYHEIQVDSSAQQSEDSIYAVMWDIVDAAAAENVVTRFSAKALVFEAQQMQAFIFAQETRALQRAAARSLLARYDRIRTENLSDSITSGNLNRVVWHDRIGKDVLHNFEEHRSWVRELITEDTVSVYRIFHHTETFRHNPCLHGMQITCQMLGFVGRLPHHKRLLRAPMRSILRRFELHG
eukprot:TRINITY_DN10432_c0_g1_i2.p1 TRINITY_DN10432_c0_g1~~TRINITY_DN10432_c0_g1_i2.p1  ORF type:complete len:479 (-),score=45.93 TRINITY_DN10432_c0_g1_i2:265-1641(-)